MRDLILYDRSALYVWVQICICMSSSICMHVCVFVSVCTLVCIVGCASNVVYYSFVLVAAKAMVSLLYDNLLFALSFFFTIGIFVSLY